MKDLFGNLTLGSSIEELALSCRAYRLCQSLNLSTIGEAAEGIKAGLFRKSRKTIFEIYDLIRAAKLPAELPHWSLVYYNGRSTPEIEATTAELDELLRQRDVAIHTARELNGVAIARLRHKIADMRHAAIKAAAQGATTMIFVFGSNEKGIHGGGAARVAREKFGATLGQGVGMQGRSYGIPTCALPTGQPNHEIPLEKVAGYVADFVRFAKDNPELEFQVTQVGCGLAGWTKEQIAPLFADAPDNCLFDTDWQPLLGDGKRYWGHVG